MDNKTYLSALFDMTGDLNHNDLENFRKKFSEEAKDPASVLPMALICFDRFYLKNNLLGPLKIFTFGGLGVWWLIDIFSALSRGREFNIKLAEKIITKHGESNAIA